MKGDFSRITFDARNHFCRVLEEMGQVRVDADHNEQVSILLHYLWTLGRDIIGPHGGPAERSGFAITPITTLGYDDLKEDETSITGRRKVGSKDEFQVKISKGHYYVDGMLCENEQDLLFLEQPDFPQLGNSERVCRGELPAWMYLKVFELYLSPLEHDAIRDVALGGVRTSSRSRLVWQVHVTKVNKFGNEEMCLEEWQKLEWYWKHRFGGQLKARTFTPDSGEAKDPCIIEPDSRYRGGNQLYRVEIHTGGYADTATWKFSRENGAVVFPIKQIAPGGREEPTTLTLGHLGQDSRFGLCVGDWVEIEDDVSRLVQEETPMVKVVDIDRDHRQVTVEGDASPVYERFDLDRHPLLRRWDHKGGDPRKGEAKLQDGALEIIEGTGAPAWLNVEHGIEVQFQPSATEQVYKYRRGDYWIIPAREVTGDIEWPQTEDHKPEAVSPKGIEYHFAPLAILSCGKGQEVLVADWRRLIEPVGKPGER